MGEAFFAALAHVRQIHANCKALLRTHHQRAGALRGVAELAACPKAASGVVDASCHARSACKKQLRALPPRMCDMPPRTALPARSGQAGLAACRLGSPCHDPGCSVLASVLLLQA